MQTKKRARIRRRTAEEEIKKYSGGGKIFFLFSKMSKPALGPTQNLMGVGALFAKGKATGA
jgi:hypothetical protein